jgi:hypothetical protein
VSRLAPLRPRLGLTPFLFRGMVLARRWWRIGFDLGCALLPLEPVDLVAQALDFRLGCPEVSPHVFSQVEPPPDEFACLFIRDAVEVQLFEQSVAGSSGET